MLMSGQAADHMAASRRLNYNPDPPPSPQTGMGSQVWEVPTGNGRSAEPSGAPDLRRSALRTDAGQTRAKVVIGLSCLRDPLPARGSICAE